MWLCVCVSVCVCVCTCVCVVPEGSEDWAAALYSDWTDTNVSGICHAFTLPPTHWSVCVCVCVREREKVRETMVVCNHVVLFHSHFITV